MKMKPDKKKPMEQRGYQFEVRAEKTDKGDVITGRPIVYDSKTDMGYFEEIIEKGALEDTDLTDVRFLVNHDMSKIPLARSRRNNGNSTMKLTTDKDGLVIEVQLDTENNAEARSLYSAVKRGDISGMSFMFVIDSEEWEDLDSDHPLRRIKKIKAVYEVSAVTFPAYSSTEINARSRETLESVRRSVETARSSVKRSVETDLELAKAKLELESKI